MPSSGYFCGHLNDDDSPGNIAPNCVRTVTTTLTNVWMGTGTDPTGVPSGATFTTLDPPQIVWLNGVPVAWQSSDDALLAELTSTSSGLPTIIASSTSSGLPTTIASSTSSATPSTVTSTHGLSNGAKAGIGVGVTIGALTALLAGLFPFRRKRPKPTEVNDEFHKTELPDTAHRVPPVELDNSSLIELDGQSNPQELPTGGGEKTRPLVNGSRVLIR